MARTTSTTTARARTSRAANEARQAASESIDDIKSDMANLKARLQNLASAGADEGVSNAQQVFARLQTRFEDLLESARDTDWAEQLGVNAALEKGREKADEARERIQENPLQSVLVAAGVGAIVGFLMRR